MPGPPPKRAAQRRRRNKSSEPESAPGAKPVGPPKANHLWHPIAKAWYNALGDSGQSRFYEPSDWATAAVIAEAISRDLKPQYVGMTETGKVVKEALPIKGASLAAYLKGMTALMVTEGDRRRLRLELEKPGPDPAQTADPKVARMSEHRSRFAG